MTAVIDLNGSKRIMERKREVTGSSRFFIMMIKLLVVSLFCQLWFDVAGFTVRLEDLITLVLLTPLLALMIYRGKIRYHQHILSVPILLWCGVLLLGISVTLLSSLDGETKKNAIVNGIRLILACGLFFVVYHHPMPASKKLNTVVSTIIAFSLVTTTVSLLQMGYWEGWLPIPLPSVLTTFKEGANTDPGRELFALYIGNSGA